MASDGEEEAAENERNLTQQFKKPAKFKPVIYCEMCLPGPAHNASHSYLSAANCHKVVRAKGASP